MLTSDPWLPSSRLAFWVSVGGVVFGLVAGFLAGAQPLYLGLAIGSVIVLVYFFADFKRTVLGLLILRSSLDIFSAQQLPAAFAIGVDVLTLLYVSVLLLTRRTVHTDGFWWFFAGWIALQGLWVVLLPLGGLGMDGSSLPTSLREWIRLFSWLMAYLLVMQLKDTITPQQVISSLFLGLVIPLTVAALQLFAPSLLPSGLANASAEIASPVEEFSRVQGTLGLANTFATFLVLFILLTWWKLGRAKWRLPWIILLGSLVFFLVNTKSLFSLIMIAIAVFVMIAPRLSLVNLLGGVVLTATVIGLFASSDFGQERLASIDDTPLLNPNMDVSRAVLLSKTDNNSFNWRLAQWTYLLQAWQQYPVLGYGLLTCSQLTVLHNYAHNEYVRAIVEGGIVGLIAFLVFLGVQIWHLLQLFHKAPKGSVQRDFCLALLAILLAMMVGMITENIWTHTTLFFYWWALFAVAGWDWDESRTSKNYVFGNSQLEIN
jgi:O-antigen ligase